MPPRRPCLGSLPSAGSPAIAWNAEKSSPAQNARPSPDSTTARTDGSAFSASPASTMAANMAPSRALSLSGRLRRTSATPPSIVTVTRSAVVMAGMLPCRRRASARLSRPTAATRPPVPERRPLPRPLLGLAASPAGSVGAAVAAAVPRPVPARQARRHERRRTSAPSSARVPVEGDAAAGAPSRLRRHRRAARRPPRRRPPSAEAELATLAARETALTARSPSSTAVREGGGDRAGRRPRARCRRPRSAATCAETSADELTRVSTPTRRWRSAGSRPTPTPSGPTTSCVADDGAAGARRRPAGRSTTPTASASEGGPAAIEVDRARATRRPPTTPRSPTSSAARAAERERARATSRVRGADFSLVALDAYWRAAAQPGRVRHRRGGRSPASAGSRAATAPSAAAGSRPTAT